MLTFNADRGAGPGKLNSVMTSLATETTRRTGAQPFAKVSNREDSNAARWQALAVSLRMCEERFRGRNLAIDQRRATTQNPAKCLSSGDRFPRRAALVHSREE